MRQEPLVRFLPDDTATARFGADLGLALRAGDVLALAGPLGAGKTTLARGLIRAVCGNPTLEVPSPTFTLMQSYQAGLSVHHLDLYRLSAPGELDELGLDEALQDGAAVVEWPERAGSRLPAGAVHVELSFDGEGRRADIKGSGPALGRVERTLAIRDFLARGGWGAASRARFTGDASARSYEIVTVPGADPRILMNSPRLALGPPVRDGKPYAEIAHTAQSVAAFVGLDRELARGGISVPEIFAVDLDEGLLLISHLGEEAFLDPGGNPVPERYQAAAELLAYLHGRAWRCRLEVGPGVWHEVPPFDREAMLIEAELLIDWYLPHLTGSGPAEWLRHEFRCEWNLLLDRVAKVEKSLVLRDFHSPNIIWRGDRKGHDRLGILDFQDALLGPAAYDVASLAMDARVTVSPELEEATVRSYVDARQEAGAFAEASFREAYAIMAAQRNSKILGIFVRLSRRDGKPGYLKHLPRIADYLTRALAHPALSGLAAFYRRNGLLDQGKR